MSDLIEEFEKFRSDNDQYFELLYEVVEVYPK